MDVEVTVHCFAVNKNKDLTINEVIGWLIKCAADLGSENSCITSIPPVRPKVMPMKVSSSNIFAMHAGAIKATC